MQIRYTGTGPTNWKNSVSKKKSQFVILLFLMEFLNNNPTLFYYIEIVNRFSIKGKLKIKKF